MAPWKGKDIAELKAVLAIKSICISVLNDKKQCKYIIPIQIVQDGFN